MGSALMPCGICFSTIYGTHWSESTRIIDCDGHKDLLVLYVVLTMASVLVLLLTLTLP